MALPTNVSVLVGRASVPVLIMLAITGAVNVLLVNVSVVALPTKVSVFVGSVNVPVLVIVEITGFVNVLFVSVLTEVNVKPTDAALLAAVVALVAAFVAEVEAAVA